MNLLKLPRLFILGFLLASLMGPPLLRGQSSAFSYHGFLTENGGPANGANDFEFRLFDAASGGNQQGSAVTLEDVGITNGLFTVALDFGAGPFNGGPRWLEIAVRPAASAGAYTNLSPRQPLTATPYALHAANATTAATATTAVTASSVSATNITGTVPLAQLPTVLITNGASGVNISGTFSGNGVGITNANVNLLTSGALTWGNFTLASSPGAGSKPEPLVAADVNGDGSVDLINGNSDTNTLTVLTNNGSGGFALAATLTVGPAPHSVTTADVNGDGSVDLISATGFTNTLAVLTNNGSGGFTLASSPNVIAQPISVVAAEVNGDGKVDLISAGVVDYFSLTHMVTVLTNGGSGDFALAWNEILPGIVLKSITSVDVSGDDRADVITAGSFGSQVMVLTNNGAGAFALASSPTVGSGPNSVAAVDVNGDGKADLITANYGTGTNGGGNTLTVLTNNGTGAFALASSPTVGSGPYSVAAADVNGDGKVDLISANYGDGSGNTLTVLINNGSGGFALATTLNVGTGPKFVTATDVNGDGRMDLVSANRGDDTLSVLWNTPMFRGNLAGNGSSITNLNPAYLTGTVSLTQLPASLVTNGASGVAFSGTFSGNGAGLTNVPGALPTQTIASTSATAQPNTTHVITSAAQALVTLPGDAAVGDVVRVEGLGTNGWGLLPGLNQSINGGVPGLVWTARDSNRGWQSVASSADGTKWVAVVYGGQIYTSTDSGVNWTARETNRLWTSVASSADGTKLVAVAEGGRIYTSTDSGETWTAREDNRGWWSVASSADGTKLAAADNLGSGGQIWTSTDSGTNWTGRAGPLFWQSVASSADGTKLVAVVALEELVAGQIYTSTDGGTNWTARESNRFWRSVASSADGAKLVAVVSSGQIYTSTDGGTNWTARDTNRLWRSVASSADGTKLVAVVNNGQVFTSTDSGTNWTARDTNRLWRSVASSADGTKLVAVEFGGKIYTSVPALAGLQGSSAELRYVGNGLWQPLEFNTLDGMNANVALLDRPTQNFTGQNTFSGNVGIGTVRPATALEVNGTVRATSFTGSGSTLTNLNASNLSSGNVADARLSTNVALRSGGNTFTGSQSFSGPISVAAGLATVGTSNRFDFNAGFPDVTLTLRQRAGDNFALAVQDSGATNRLLVTASGVATAGALNATGALNVNSPGFATAAAIIRARATDQFPFAVQDFTGINLLLVQTNGQVNLGNDGGTPQMVVYPKQVTIAGDAYALAFIPTSDRNAKENFTPVSPSAVLDKVLSLPISRWNFKADADTPHLGPMAQDFHAAFGLGPDDKHIATVDADGVALAAIQGLNEKLETRSQDSGARIHKLETENAELKERLGALEKLFNSLKAVQKGNP